MVLEQHSEMPGGPIGYRAPVGMVDGLVQIDTHDLFATLLKSRETATPQLAGWFHEVLAEATARACAVVREGSGLDRAVLGGGVFHNDRFTAALVRRLTGTGFRVFLPREVPVGDGGIALGQVLVANANREAV